MSKIDWRSMFKGVLSRMRDAGESNEMGARWMATAADAAVYDLTAERDRLREENERLRAGIAEAAKCLEGEPEYHHSGMGCGLEDRNITDRYDAMEHGWECALERVYGEHINGAREILAGLSPEGSK